MLNGQTSILVDPKAYRVNSAIDALGLGEKQPLGITYHEFAHSLSQSREKTDHEFWKNIRKIKKEYEGIRGKREWFDVKISDYASKDVDEFLAESFTQAKLCDNPSPYSKQVLEIVDKYFKKKSVETARNNGIIKPDKVVSGHDGTPQKAGSGMVIDHLGKDNKTETRTFYGENGYKKKDITNHNHGFPAKHPYGKSGEHAHDYEWDADGRLKNRTTREITDDERKENSDIL